MTADDTSDLVLRRVSQLPVLTADEFAQAKSNLLSGQPAGPQPSPNYASPSGPGPRPMPNVGVPLPGNAMACS